MKTYTQDEIDKLIACRKVVTEPPKREMKSQRGHKRNSMLLRSEDGGLEFSVFMRINEDFPEDFTIGLNFSPRDELGTLCLFRCNGPHGHFLGSAASLGAHFQYHIHRAKAENIEASLRAEHGGEPTEGYASYRDAFAFFLNEIRIINALDYFPELSQPMLRLNFPEREPEE